MQGYIQNIEKITLENENFRRVLYTAQFSQLVVMAVRPTEDIGEEIHDVDQFLRIEQGHGRAVLDDVSHPIVPGTVILVPAGTKHNIINESDTEPLKLYSLYSPPHHRDQVVHATKQDASNDTEHFAGITTES